MTLRCQCSWRSGVAFLSGGQSCELASARLNAMNIRFRSHSPWAVAFSFARAIQEPRGPPWRVSGHYGKDTPVVRGQGSLTDPDIKKVVEAGGVEPPSEKASNEETTCVATFYNLIRRLRARKIAPNQPD